MIINTQVPIIKEHKEEILDATMTKKDGSVWIIKQKPGRKRKQFIKIKDKTNK